jgi:hypothetical protein
MPTQSLADMRCQMWHSDRLNPYNSEPCPTAPAFDSAYLPQLSQSPQTLYVGWRICGVFWPTQNGVQTQYTGFNVEYTAQSRTLTIHCYSAKAWISIGGPHYARGVPNTAILLVPTARMAPGQLRVLQEDRIERLIGDETTETLLGTATIA